MPGSIVAGTSGKQAPYGIKGTVTVNGTAFHGARIWLRDTTEGTEASPVDDHTQVYTNASGKYTINLGDSTNAYANGDSVTVYCLAGRLLGTSVITVSKRAGYSTVNFSFTRGSGLTDGVRGSPLVDGPLAGKGGLSRQLSKGCSDGIV